MTKIGAQILTESTSTSCSSDDLFDTFDGSMGFDRKIDTGISPMMIPHNNRPGPVGGISLMLNECFTTLSEESFLDPSLNPYLVEDEVKEEYHPALGPIQHNLIVTPDQIGNYEVEGKIGEGGYGTVVLATLLDQEVAIKVIDKPVKDRALFVAGIAQEVSVLQRFWDHPNIIGIEEVINTDDAIYVVMEKASCDLSGLVKVVHLIEQEDWRQQVMIGVLCALIDLHAKGVYHMDLKAENILISFPEFDGVTIPRIEASHVRLADFGLSMVSPSEDQPAVHLPPSLVVGTPGFVAPEIMLGRGGDAGLADMWSLGCTLLEASEGSPLISLSKNSNYLEFADENERLYKDFLFKNLLQRTPEDRASPTELLEHDWLRTSYPFTPTVQTVLVSEVL